MGEERQASICCKSRNSKTSVVLLSVQRVTVDTVSRGTVLGLCLFIVHQVTLIEKFISIS